MKRVSLPLIPLTEHLIQYKVSFFSHEIKSKKAGKVK